MAVHKYRIAGNRLLLLAALIALTGCRAYVLDNAQDDLRSSFLNGNYEQSSALLEKYGKDDVYKSKDKVLYNLEYGTVLHFAGSYDSSSTYFGDAENQIEALYTKSISTGAASLLLSDNALEYDGEEYENIYLNAFKALNFMHLGDYEAALVESRRIAFKLEQLDIRVKGLAEALSKQDSTSITDWDAGEANVQSSAFGHYLSAVLFAKSGNPDGARIEYDKLQQSLREQDTIRRYYGPDPKDLPELDRPGSYNVLFNAFTGFAPRKRQEDVRFFWGEDDVYVKFSFPVLQMYDTQVVNIKVTAGDDVYYLDMIEEMDAVAADVYKSKEPIIYARALARAVLKAGGAKFITNKIEKQDGTLGIIAQILSFIGKEVSEKADLRAWQTLPGQAWMQVIDLPEGDHKILIEYIDEFDRVLYWEERDLTITPRTQLELIETIYSL